jgi:hypothetical protein
VTAPREAAVRGTAHEDAVGVVGAVEVDLEVVGHPGPVEDDHRVPAAVEVVAVRQARERDQPVDPGPPAIRARVDAGAAPAQPVVVRAAHEIAGVDGVDGVDGDARLVLGEAAVLAVDPHVIAPAAEALDRVADVGRGSRPARVESRLRAARGRRRRVGGRGGGCGRGGAERGRRGAVGGPELRGPGDRRLLDVGCERRVGAALAVGDTAVRVSATAARSPPSRHGW